MSYSTLVEQQHCCHQRDGECVGVGGGPTLVYSVHSVKSTDIMMTNTYAGQAGDCVD